MLRSSADKKMEVWGFSRLQFFVVGPCGELMGRLLFFGLDGTARELCLGQRGSI